MKVSEGNSFIRNIVRCKNRGAAIIAEIKPYSPASGDLLRGRDVVRIAEEYIEGGAACLSVVTGRWFKGSVDLLEKVAANVSFPILRKDFIVNFDGIRISRELGASAVLLTAKLIEKDFLTELSQYACSINLVPFVEVSGEGDLNGITLPPGTVLAVNNKSIRTKEMDRGDIKRSTRLINCCKSKNAELYVSASGISTQKQIVQLLTAGFDALLIGTALLKAEDIRSRVKQLSSTTVNSS